MRADEDALEEVTRVKLLTVSEAAELLNVSCRVIRRLINIGELKAFDLTPRHSPRRTLRIVPRSVDALLRMRETKGYLPDRRYTYRDQLEFLRSLHGKEAE